MNKKSPIKCDKESLSLLFGVYQYLIDQNVSAVLNCDNTYIFINNELIESEVNQNELPTISIFISSTIITIIVYFKNTKSVSADNIKDIASFDLSDPSSLDMIFAYINSITNEGKVK